MKNIKSKINEKQLIFKFLLCLIYLIVITILFSCAYKLHQEKEKILAWEDVKTVEDYSYIEISKMSEKFAYYEESNKQIHFVIEKEDTGLWHTYLIAISPDDYDKYKDIIDYTYERTTEVPKNIKVYGYPVIMDNNLKELAIKNITNFVPKENEIEITSQNFEKYLTNSYLDTTLEKKDNFNTPLFIILFLIIIMIVLFIYTIISKEKIINIKINKKRDSIEEII